VTVIEKWTAYQRELAARALRATTAPLRILIAKLETAAADAKRKVEEGK